MAGAGSPSGGPGQFGSGGNSSGNTTTVNYKKYGFILHGVNGLIEIAIGRNEELTHQYAVDDFFENLALGSWLFRHQQLF